VKTRRQAHEDGEKTYKTGTPCNRGHDTPRYTSTGGCVGCNRMKASETRKNYLNKNWGYTKHTVTAHKLDIPKINEYAKTLEMARKLQEGKI